MNRTSIVCVAKDALRLCPHLPEYPTFSTETCLSLPHREVAWMSGATEYLADIERTLDDMRVLSDDGSTVDLLAKALALVEARKVASICLEQRQY